MTRWVAEWAQEPGVLLYLYCAVAGFAALLTAWSAYALKRSVSPYTQFRDGLLSPVELAYLHNSARERAHAAIVTAVAELVGNGCASVQRGLLVVSGERHVQTAHPVSAAALTLMQRGDRVTMWTLYTDPSMLSALRAMRRSLRRQRLDVQRRAAVTLFTLGLLTTLGGIGVVVAVRLIVFKSQWEAASIVWLVTGGVLLLIAIPFFGHHYHTMHQLRRERDRITAEHTPPQFAVERASVQHMTAAVALLGTQALTRWCRMRVNSP